MKSTRPDSCRGRAGGPASLRLSLGLADRKQAKPDQAPDLCDLCQGTNKYQASLSPGGTGQDPEGLRGKSGLK